MNRNTIRYLKRLSACSKAVQWVSQQQSPASAWRDCECADWMMWLIGKTCAIGSDRHRRLVLLSCRIASDALRRHWGRDDARPRAALRMSRLWVRGSATTEQVRHAADAAADAAYSATAAADAAAARAKALRRYAGWVRREFPNPPRIK